MRDYTAAFCRWRSFWCFAECGDAERKSGGQYDAGSIQRDGSGRGGRSQSDSVRLSAASARAGRRCGNCGQPVLGKNQTVPMKRLASAAMRFGLVLSIALFAVVSLIPYRVMGNFHTGQRNHRRGCPVLKYYPIYLPVFCSDTDSSGYSPQCRDSKNRV